MGFLDILEAAATVGAELFRDRVSDITDWIDGQQAAGAARVYLARVKEESGYVVGARAVNARDRIVAEHTWHVRANTGVKAFMQGAQDEGLGELFEGKKEIYYELNDWDSDEYEEEDEEDDDVFDEDEDEEDDFDDEDDEEDEEDDFDDDDDDDYDDDDYDDDDYDDDDYDDQPVQPAARGNFCTNCGQKLAPGAKFCGNCGNRAG